MKILVTGGDGFVGSHLVRELRSLGREVSAPVFEIRDPAAVFKVVGESCWDQVIHLAAVSHVNTCEKDPATAWAVNRDGTRNLLEACLRYSPQSRLIFASTAQVYAGPEGDEELASVTFREDRRIAPQNLYAETKLECERLIQAASEDHGFRATILRMFNHSHKSQPPAAFLPYLYSVLEPKKGQSIQVPVGNLELHRDIGSIQDLVSAWLAVSKLDVPGVFNVCSGVAKHLRALAEGMARELGVNAEFVTDPSRVRPDEPKLIRGDHAKLTSATGWSPQFTSEKALIRSFLS